ncbi:hypothetical protein R3F64_01220 [Halomonas sp. 5021]|jgi:hypothetical protein|uniref:hypothetical protein n=1 Tax=Halomonas sp. 5021 TaxID=3082156 RepID=UPI002FCCB848
MKSQTAQSKAEKSAQKHSDAEVLKSLSREIEQSSLFKSLAAREEGSKGYMLLPTGRVLISDSLLDRLLFPKLPVH